MPVAYILVGLPGVGKSTWIDNQTFDWDRTVVASTDNYVEKIAQSVGKTYSEVFERVMSNAVHEMASDVKRAVEHGYDIVWDQTSLTVDTRSRKLRMLPDSYKCIAVVFAPPGAEEHLRRLSNRPGKHIPQAVIDRMRGQFVMPTLAEGFDRVVYADLINIGEQ